MDDRVIGDGALRQPGVGTPDHLERLWTPHRMSYITAPAGSGSAGGRGEPFLEIPRMSDEDGLMIARGETVFVCLNLYPYNAGHSMVIPYRRVADIEDLTTEEAHELMDMTRKLVRTIKHVSSPQAFNIGLNLGPAAGGSLSQHLHQHVVPRWHGDANFITVIGGTKMMPQLLGDTRTLLADAWRELHA